MTYNYLILDLDSTLYPYESGMEQRMDAMIDDFVTDHLNLSSDHVRSIRRNYYARYGTTIAGLIKHHGIDPEAYYRYIHNFDFREYIHPSPWLKELLDCLNVRKVVFSNSPRDYVRAVLEILGIASCFEAVYDIAFCGYFGKPNPDSFQSVLNHLGANPRECIFVDNSLSNVINAHQLGFASIWLTGQSHNSAGESRQAGEYAGFSAVITDIRELAVVVPALLQPGEPASQNVS